MTRKKIERSGVLPYYIEDGEIKILFMKPSEVKYGGDAFQMAKGKHEEGETAEEAGLREGNEELGLYKGNIEHLHNLGVFLGRTTVFVAKIKDPDFFGDPHFETDETKWMTPDEFDEEGRDLHKAVIKAAVRYIEKYEDMK
jgi:8-oxo-dGTP pyrophosphatase MutT (NUDIX family)